MDEASDGLKQQQLAKVLLDFGRAPGKYPVRLGEPRELHAGLDTLTVWALGRLPKELESQAGALRDAAVLFIARACFAPEATHYQMFGLTAAACTPDALRSRYRNLIRLTHPDMGIKGLPSNAAGAVNRAQGVLSDPQLRRRYDEDLADRKTGAGTSDRNRQAQGQGVRRIEHRVTFAERWQSLKAGYPNLARTGALAGGVVVVSVGLLVLALTSQNDERTLIFARNPGRDTGREPVGKPADLVRAPTPGSAMDTAAPAARTAALAGAAPVDSRDSASPRTPAAQFAQVASELGRNAADLSKSGRMGSIGSSAPPTFDSRADATRGGAERRAPDVLIDPSARLRGDANAEAAGDAVRGWTPKTPLATRAIEAQAPPVVAGPTSVAMAEPRRGPANRPEVPAEPLPLAETASNRSASVPRPVPAPPVTSAAPAAPPSPGAGPSPAPPVRIATAAPQQAPSPVVNPTAKPAQAVADAGAQVWKVDTISAMHYLGEVISMLEKPNAAYRTNAYLQEMKVKGSLLNPALKMMRDFSEVDVSRVDWSDSTAPGVLKVRGTLVLQAKGSQAPFNRTANFRLTAEFWGTPNGTVLAELNLRETE